MWVTSMQTLETVQKAQTINYMKQRKLCYLEDSSWRNNLRTESVEEEEEDKDENWDQSKKKVGILKY